MSVRRKLVETHRDSRRRALRHLRGRRGRARRAGNAAVPPGQLPIDLRGGHVLNNHITTKSWSFDYEHARLSPDGLSGTVNGVRNGVVFRKGKPYSANFGEAHPARHRLARFHRRRGGAHRANQRPGAPGLRYGSRNLDERRQGAKDVAPQLRSFRWSNADDQAISRSTSTTTRFTWAKSAAEFQSTTDARLLAALFAEFLLGFGDELFDFLAALMPDLFVKIRPVFFLDDLAAFLTD